MINFRAKSNIDIDTLFEQYNSYVFKIVINESNGAMTKEDIEETVSDIFFALWKNSKNIKDHKKIKSYIGVVAKNTTRNKLRTIKQELAYDDNAFVPKQEDNNSYLVNEQLSIVRRELDKGDDVDREIFFMYYYDNKKIKEISEIKNMNISTVKTRLHRTKKKLKKSLEKGGFKHELR